MKAGAFGRTPQRRDVQPGGRVLPGMFASPSPSASSASSSSKPAAPAVDPSPPLISSWGTGSNGSGRLSKPPAEPSRLERLRAERASEGSAGLSGGRSSSVSRDVEASDSISRARRLGLNRAPKREPTPPPDSEEEEEEQGGWFASPPKGREREAAEPTVLPGASRFTRPSPPPPSQHTRSSSAAAAPVDSPIPRSADPAAADKPQQGLLGSLWDRAAQLVGGGAAGENVVKEVQHGRKDSASDPELGVPESKVTPFELHDSEGGEHGGASNAGEGEGKDNPLKGLPPHVARAASDPTSNSHRSRRPAVPALPPVEPITYRRPPALYPDDVILSAPRTRGLHHTPYDWLEGRDESPLDPFLFHRQPGRAATRKSRSAKTAAAAAVRPVMPQSVRTDPGPVAAGAASMGTIAAQNEALPAGLFRTLTAHPSMPPAAPHHPTYAPLPPPVPPVPPLPHSAVTGYQPLPQHGYDQPAPLSAAFATPTAPANPYYPAHLAAPVSFAPPSSGFEAPPAVHPGYAAPVAAAAPAALVATAQPVGGMPGVGGPSLAAVEPGEQREEEEPGLPSYAEHTATEPATSAAAEGLPTPASAPAPISTEPPAPAHPASAEEAFPRAGAGPNSLPTFPAPAPSPIPQPSQLPASSSAPQYSVPPASAPPNSFAAPAAGSLQPPQPQPAAPPAPSAPAQGPPAAHPAAAPTAVPAQPANAGPPVHNPLGAQLSAPPAPASAPHPPAPPSYPGAAGWPPHSAGPPHPYGIPPYPLPPHLAHPQPQHLATSHPAAGSGTSATGGLPPMPIPRPILATPPPPTSLPPGTTPSMSLYPAHLAALQPLPITPPVATAGAKQPAWPGQPYPYGVAPFPAVTGQNGAGALVRLPTPAAPPASPSPSVHGEGQPGLADSAVPVLLATADKGESEAADPNLPVYSAPPAPVTAVTPSSSLGLPTSAALNTPLPPSPAPPSLPLGGSPLPFGHPTSSTPAASPSIVPPLSLPPLDGPPSGEALHLPSYNAAPPVLTSHPLPPTPAPSLSISTVASPSPPPVPTKDGNSQTGLEAAAQIVFTPPTPIEPRGASAIGLEVSGGGEQEAYHASAAPVEDLEQDPEPEQPRAPSPAPALTLQPLELGWSLPDLGFGLDLGFERDAASGQSPTAGEAEDGGFLAALGLARVGEEVKQGGELPLPQRASSPMAEYGTEVLDEDDNIDAMSDAFEATASFVAAFADERLARAAKDPNHSERTERWLVQQGVQRKPMGELKTPVAELKSEAEGKKVEEREPDSGIFRPRTAPPASVAPDLRSSRFTFSSAAPFASGNNTLTHPSPSSLSVPPPSASSRSHGRSLSLTPAALRSLAEETDGTEGPPSPIETSIHINNVLNRPRAVSVGEDRQVETRPVEVDRTAALAALSNSAFAGSTGESGTPKSRAEAKEGDLLELTGDKGETASEIGRMFSGW